jgi:hypothetical protein
VPFDPRQKPTRITVQPGQQWRAPDDRERAVVTRIGSTSSWGRDDVVTVTFLRWQKGVTTVETVELDEFRRRFSERVD